MSPAHIHCDFCGLPIRGSAPQASTTGDAPPEPEFCCYGCRFASQVTRERGDAGAVRWTLVRLGLSIFLSMNVMAFSMALWTVDVYGEEAGGSLGTTLFSLFRYLCLLFSLPVLILLGGPLWQSAAHGLRRGVLSTDLLLLAGTVAAFVQSAISVFRDGGPIYFEVACVILVMVTLGRWFEAAGRLRAGAALDELQRLLPEFVRVVRAGQEEQVPAANVARGVCLRVLPGERFPTDGRLIEGRAHVDQQILTGESRPAFRDTGAEVFAGTLNLDGSVLVEVTSDPGDGSLDRLIAAVREAREAKGYYQQLADRISAWVFPVVALTAVITFGWHLSHANLEQAISAGLAVVLVACPCALGLATPLAAWTAIGAAARKHVLFRNGQALERLAEIRAVRFDKTGTLTTGQVRVVCCLLAVPAESAGGRQILDRVQGLAVASLHPFSCAVRDYAREQSTAEPSGDLFTNIQQLSGRGMSGHVRDSGETVFLGSRLWMTESQLTLPTALEPAIVAAEERGHSLVCAGWGGTVQAVFLLEEELRPTAAAAIDDCRHLGLDVAILTGDHQGRARRLTTDLQVPVFAELLPDNKLVAIRQVQSSIGPVAMVGDGINDAPALAASDVGVALGCGADVSRDAAQVCLLTDDPARLAWAIHFARNAVHVMRRNLFWAFAYNSVGVVLAASGSLNPAIAALLMVVSSLLVVRSALSLQGEPDALHRPLHPESVPALSNPSHPLPAVPT